MKAIERALQIFPPQEILGFPKPRYVHGEIPTRADVHDPEYQRVVQEEAIAGALDSLLGSLNPTLLHNHLVSALRQIRGDPFDAEALYTGNSRPYFDSSGQRSPLGYIRLGVEKLLIDGALDPVSIADYYLQILRGCKEIVETTEPFLTGFSRPVSLVTNLRYESIPPGVKEQKTEGGGQSDIFGWQYSFTPKEVFQGVVGPLEQNLLKLTEEILTGKGNSLKNIQKLWKLLDSFEKTRPRDFLGSCFILPQRKSAFSMECDPTTEAGRLFQENLRIAKGCDIFTRFDLFYLIVKVSEEVKTLVGFSEADNPAEEATEFALLRRMELRDFIDGRIKIEGKVVINGMTITLAPRGFSADTMVPQWLVNVLGALVRISGGWLLTPDVLTGRERSLIAEFRALSEKERWQIPFHPVIAEILATYESFQDRGRKTSPQEQLSRILEILESRGFTDEEVLAERPIL